MSQIFCCTGRYHWVEQGTKRQRQHMVKDRVEGTEIEIGGQVESSQNSRLTYPQQCTPPTEGPSQSGRTPLLHWGSCRALPPRHLHLRAALRIPDHSPPLGQCWWHKAASPNKWLVNRRLWRHTPKSAQVDPVECLVRGRCTQKMIPSKWIKNVYKATVQKF